MNFLNTDIVFNKNGKTQCINCHRKDTVFIKIKWLLLCESCLEQYLKELRKEKYK